MDIFKKLRNSASETITKMQRSDEVKKWLFELEQARKREEKWRKDAKVVVETYEQEGSLDSSDLQDFNILYANTETLAPAVFNNTPRPVVKRRIKEDDPIAMAAAKVIKHTLMFLTDAGSNGKMPFDELQKTVVQEALVPGRGTAHFLYEASIDYEGTEAETVKEESVCWYDIPWNRFYHGYAKSWYEVPWIAYEYFWTQEECVKQFGDVGKQIKLTHSSEASDEKERANQPPQDAEGVKFAHLYRIQDKATKTIFWVSEGYASILDKQDDPLKLEGFFDCPKPITFLNRVSSLQPQTLYKMYRQQAEELDLATRRIRGILKAMKVRGMYDSTVEGIDELLKSDENTLLPANNIAALAQGQTLEKAIWFMPLETLITVLQQLYVARQQTIQVIQQITGIADIMRGATQASETLGAQKMKESWGTLKLKRMQKEVQRYTRDCYRMQAELACNHFSVETFIQMTGLKYPRQVERQQAIAGMDQIKQRAATAQAFGQQIPPEQAQQAQQQMQMLQQMVQIPTWEEITAFLKNDDIRNFVIDIETNSTIDLEATEDKQELAEMMNSMSQLLNGVLPMVEQGILPFEAAKSLCLAVIRKFRLGDEVEETFAAMQQPQPKQDPAMAKVQADIQRDNNKAKLDVQKMERQQQIEERNAQMEAEVQKEKLDLQRQANQVEREKLQMEAEFNAAQHAMKMQQLQMQAVVKATPPARDPNKQPGGEGTQNAGA